MKPPAEIIIEKLVHGGQALGAGADGKKAFIWNALPGEVVLADLRKNKRKYLEGVAVEIKQASPDRIAPLDEAYLSTSPWQIMTYEVENRYKQEILAETLAREHVAASGEIPFVSHEQQWHYRNKMEYSFWADDDGLHLALFHRASHGKRIVAGSSIAMSAIDETANAVLQVLRQSGIRGSQLKTVIVRCNQAGKAVAALFVKDHEFPQLDALRGIGDGVVVYYSNPKSPASVVTEELYRFGTTMLTDTILDVPITYDVNSFFQVHLPVFSQAAQAINDYLADQPERVDMYAGVGTLALLSGATKMVEIDMHNTDMAARNAEGRNLEIVLAPSERAVEHITHDAALIVDPPRAGLHADVTSRILEVLPPKVAYLSCNPITQARDLALLQTAYQITSITGYNFFPRTPHIESLALLERR